MCHLASQYVIPFANTYPPSLRHNKDMLISFSQINYFSHWYWEKENEHSQEKVQGFFSLIEKGKEGNYYWSFTAREILC